MKKLILAAALAFAPLPALAADTLTITIVSDAASGYTGTLSKTWTFTAADLGKFYTWVQAAYPCVATPPATCTTTIPSAVLLWAQAFIAGTAANVNNAFANAAADAARAGVTPINPN